jgi:predicted DCC family thiol-disulfide oxidoreductase YuxK
MEPAPGDRPLIVLFDGDCAFCNGWVRWIQRRDRNAVFGFHPLASDEGVRLRARHGVPDDIDSVVLVENDAAHTKSGAAWRILRRLPGWGVASLLLRIIPRPLRDLGYDLVSRNRHRLGMKDECELPR